MLSTKDCHLILLCLPHHFGTLLTIFAKLKYYFDFDKAAISLQPSRNDEVCHFPILIEKYRFFLVRNHKAVEGLSFFPYKNLICYFPIWWNEVNQCLITDQKLDCFGWFFFINVTKSLLKLLCFLFCRWNMWRISRKQLIKFSVWLWHRKSDTRLYSYIRGWIKKFWN